MIAAGVDVGVLYFEFVHQETEAAIERPRMQIAVAYCSVSVLCSYHIFAHDTDHSSPEDVRPDSNDRAPVVVLHVDSASQQQQTRRDNCEDDVGKRQGHIDSIAITRAKRRIVSRGGQSGGHSDEVIPGTRCVGWFYAEAQERERLLLAQCLARRGEKPSSSKDKKS